MPIKKSVTPDFLICLEDGQKFKSLKRHLRTTYNLTPDEYRAKWGLPPDYPMVSPILRGAFQFGEDHGSWAKTCRKPQTFKKGCVMVRGASLAPLN